MKKTFRNLPLCAALLFVIMVPVSPLSAAGIGIFGSYGEGMVRYTYDYRSTGFKSTTLHGGKHWDVGILFDTCVAHDELLNYRLRLAYRECERRFSWETLIMRGFVMYHIFGLGVYRSEYVRLWLGPELGYGMGFDKYEKGNLEAFGTVGAMMGINVHIAGTMTFFIEAGARYGFFAGDANNIDQMYGSGYEFAAGFGIIYRINDEYRYVEEM
jgi:hypothetical protein